MFSLDCASAPASDLGTVDCIARVRLAAGEQGEEVRLENVDPNLLELLNFCGLAELLRIEMERHPE